ncbi:phytase [Sphingomonas sp.]|uniref:phytase n=1 Tax=Sphingomonas sp. TaxID=28214 RepID=UPI002D7ECEF9|nr:phytase [Sphingomonas sp.]HEU0045296.1 phytase [Sphingomonas sp.]
MKRIALIAAALTGCTTLPATAPTGTGAVTALRETTAVATANADAADDPAIWADRRNPARSLIVATDKRAGLNVYGVDGRLRSSFPAGRVNNVDLREWRGRIVVAASDRNDPANGKLALFTLDPVAATLTPLGVVPAGPGEAYGLCMTRRADALYAFVVMKDGMIVQLRLGADARSATVVRRMKLATQSEGCVVDDRNGQLFVGEENVGIWRFDAAPGGSVEPIAVARGDGIRLIPDVEGLAIAAQGRRGGYLVASSQGDNAYALWRLPDLTYAGRVRVVAGGAIDGTSETDGIDVSTATVPGFPGGLLVVQDGDNAPEAQNFKLIAWHDVLSRVEHR